MQFSQHGDWYGDSLATVQNCLIQMLIHSSKSFHEYWHIRLEIKENAQILSEINCWRNCGGTWTSICGGTWTDDIEILEYNVVLQQKISFINLISDWAQFLLCTAIWKVGYIFVQRSCKGNVFSLMRILSNTLRIWRLKHV